MHRHHLRSPQVLKCQGSGFVLGRGLRRGWGQWGKREASGVKTQAYSRVLVFLIGGNIAGVLLLLQLLGGDHCFLVNFTLGHFGSRLDWLLLLLILALLLGAPTGAGVNAGLVAVALASSGTHRGAGIGDARPDASLLTFQ